MSKLKPLTEFGLAVTYFILSHGRDRARLRPAIDALQRSPEWRGAGPYLKQLVTACERACDAVPLDLPKAVEGVREIARLEADERNAPPAWKEELEAAMPRAERPGPLPDGARQRRVGGAAAGAVAGDGCEATAPAAVPEPPHTRWDERLDLQ